MIFSPLLFTTPPPIQYLCRCLGDRNFLVLTHRICPTKPSISCHYWTMHLAKCSKEKKIWQRQVWRAWRMKQIFPFDFMKGVGTYPRAEFPNLDHWMKRVHHSFVITIDLLRQFSGCLMWIYVKNVIQSLFMELNWSIGVWSVLDVKIPIFEVLKPTAGSTLRLCLQ